MIPQIIHQTWKTSEVPEQFRASQASWVRHHPNWRYMFWTDADLDAFVCTHYPEMISLFRSYPDQIQRVDSARYLLLFKYGGIYADLDIMCLRSFEPLRIHETFVPETKPLGVSNDLMGSEPGSLLMQTAIRRLAPSFRLWQRRFIPRHFRVLLTTGSLFLTSTVRACRGRPVLVIPGRLYGDGTDPASYVAHLPGATWHHWDSDMFVFMFRHAPAFAVGLAAAVIGLLLLL